MDSRCSTHAPDSRQRATRLDRRRRTSVTFLQKLQFSFLVDIRHGSQAYNGTRGALYHYGVHKDTEIRDQMRSFRHGLGTPVLSSDPAPARRRDRRELVREWRITWSANTADFIEGAGFTKLREIASSTRGMGSG